MTAAVIIPAGKSTGPYQKVFAQLIDPEYYVA